MDAPYGTWVSRITAGMVAAQGLRLSGISVDGDDIYWLEGRPSEGGRTVLVRRTADGHVHDVTHAPFNVRTRVHEYGGGACVVADRVAWFSNFADQRLYRVAIDEGVPVAVTPEGPWCFADAVVDRRRRNLICVREDHSTPGAGPTNAIVSIPLDDGGASAGDVIASGYDFYSTPRLSPDATRVSWLCWRHPNMPWDGTELWVADVEDDGRVTHAVCIAGGADESIYQPGWLPDGSLCFASDRDGWWRLYRLPFSDDRSAAEHRGSAAMPILKGPPPGAEFGRPQWVFGTATWSAVDRERLVASYTTGGRWRLAVLDLPTGGWSDVCTELEPLDWLTATPTHALMVAASPTDSEAVVRVELASGRVDVLRSAASDAADPASISVPQAIEFPTAGDCTAHAFYYVPHNPLCTPLPADRPPLIVIGHGGPTTATRATLDLKVQFWTSRGFAVVDVNYGGSSGYGRDYRQRLNGQWGIVDVADMVHAARFLVQEGKADPQRLIIRGASAGGYSTLAALTFHPDVFGAGASYYGICDLEVLAGDTHKFESRYLDSMIGAYPAMRDVYRARSPIHFVDRLSCALILFQGLEDRVVPPNQSEMMADAVRSKGSPVAYLTFPGEQHGFRKAETIIRCLEAELFFYGAVFGFTIADAVEPPVIDNLRRDGTTNPTTGL